MSNGTPAQPVGETGRATDQRQHRPHPPRNFARSKPDQLWVTDITEHPTREGRVYCAVVLDYRKRRTHPAIGAQPEQLLICGDQPIIEILCHDPLGMTVEQH